MRAGRASMLLRLFRLRCGEGSLLEPSRAGAIPITITDIKSIIPRANPLISLRNHVMGLFLRSTPSHDDLMRTVAEASKSKNALNFLHLMGLFSHFFMMNRTRQPTASAPKRTVVGWKRPARSS